MGAEKDNSQCAKSVAPEVPRLPTRVIIDVQGGYCNLKCPKCFVHGPDDNEAIKKLRGRMSLENARKLLDEVVAARPLITPNLWTEPLMAKDFKTHIATMKSMGFPVALNTNGLLLDEEMAEFLVEVEMDSVFVSIDATTPEVLIATRGTDKLAQIEESVFTLLRARKDKTLPRIGVSFTTEEANIHQRDEFVERWLAHVDVVRIGDRFAPDGTVKQLSAGVPRTPCAAIYHSMAIHFNGQVSICCLDGYQETNMGNVLTDGGIEAVWNGEKFREVRHFHETNQYDKVPFCKGCDVWASHTFSDEVVGDLLIRRAPLMTYYNRLDRMGNWNEKHNTRDDAEMSSPENEQRVSGEVWGR